MRYKQVKTRRLIFGILHFLCMFGPIVGFVIYGLCTGETVEKVTLTTTCLIAIIMAAVSLFLERHRAGIHKSILWIMIIVISHCLNRVEVFIWILAVSSLLDELLFAKLFSRYCELCRTNKEIMINARTIEKQK